MDINWGSFLIGMLLGSGVFFVIGLWIGSLSSACSSHKKFRSFLSNVSNKAYNRLEKKGILNLTISLSDGSYDGDDNDWDDDDDDFVGDNDDGIGKVVDTFRPTSRVYGPESMN